MKLLRLPLLAVTLGLVACDQTSVLRTPALGPLDALTLSAAVGGRTTRELSVTNTGNAPLTYALSLQNAPWLKVKQGLSGTVAPGQAGRVEVEATCGPEAGRFTGTLTVSADGLPKKEVPVTLTCQADTTPEAFTFTPLLSVPVGAVVTSDAVTVSGIDAPAPITVTGGTLLINGEVSTAATVKSGDRVAVRVTAPALLGAAAQATVTIGGVSATFTVQTAEAVDLTGEWVLNLNQPNTPNRRIWLKVFESAPAVRGAGYVGYVQEGGQFIEPYSGQIGGTLNGSGYTLTLFVYDFYDTNTNVKYEFRGTRSGNTLSGSWTRTDVRLGVVTGSGSFAGTPTNQ